MSSRRASSACVRRCRRRIARSLPPRVVSATGESFRDLHDEGDDHSGRKVHYRTQVNDVKGGWCKRKAGEGMTVKTVGVVGAGTMGSGIAQVFAQAGYDVRLIDDSPQ